mmetsp:Transcript_8486/g.18555  ORF Transcript_8486/g.18555 Transcript_8486/m.18555 type:complete len:218 (-) Transcript_8486:124-777(-)
MLRTTSSAMLAFTRRLPTAVAPLPRGSLPSSSTLIVPSSPSPQSPLSTSRGMTILSKESAEEYKKRELHNPHGQNPPPRLPPRDHLLLPHLRHFLHHHPRHRLRPLLRRRGRRPRGNFRRQWRRPLSHAAHRFRRIGRSGIFGRGGHRGGGQVLGGVSVCVPLFGGIEAFGVGWEAGDVDECGSGEGELCFVWGESFARFFGCCFVDIVIGFDCIGT